MTEPVAIHRAAEPGAATLLLLHGRGGDERDLVDLVGTIAPGAGILAPRGPEPEPAGYAWFRHHRVGVPVLESLRQRLAELSEWLDTQLSRHGVARPIAAIGFSNGGMMAGCLAAARPDLVGAVALLSSAYPLPEEILGLGGLAGMPVFAASGDRDSYHPPETFAAGVASYRAAGAVVEAVPLPGAGHEITPGELTALAAWLRGATPRS